SASPLRPDRADHQPRRCVRRGTSRPHKPARSSRCSNRLELDCLERPAHWLRRRTKRGSEATRSDTPASERQTQCCPRLRLASIPPYGETRLPGRTLGCKQVKHPELENAEPSGLRRTGVSLLVAVDFRL